MTILTTIRRWHRTTAEHQALNDLGPDGRQELARDLGLSETSLLELASQQCSAEELPLLLREVSLDPNKLKMTHPAVMRDMQVVCSTCREKSCCRSDLELRVSAATYDEYCPNADTIDALQQEKARAASSRDTLLTRE